MITQSNLIDLNRIYTAEEFEALPDDGHKYELIEGKLVEMPPAGDRHGRIIKRLFKHIMAFDPQESLGEVWVTTGVRLNKKNVPEPDLAFIVTSRMPPESPEALKVMPDLAVEVWSPSQLIRKGPDKASLEKIERYLQAGIRIIWSVNPDKQMVDVYHLGQTNPIQTLNVNDELDGEDVIPGFKLKVRMLFE